MGEGLRNGDTLEGRRIYIMRCINRVTMNINIGKMTEEVLKEATVMRTVEERNDKRIGEEATMAKGGRWCQMFPRAICGSESLLSWRKGWPNVWCVLTGSNRLLLLGTATLAIR